MVKNHKTQPDWYEHQTIDSAALAGAATAAVLTIFMGEGPFMPMNAIVGITLLFVLFGYELRRPRKHLQHAAFGGVCALCLLLIVGFIHEFKKGSWELDYWKPLQEAKRTNVDPWLLVIWWFVSAAVFTVAAWIGKVAVTNDDTTPPP